MLAYDFGKVLDLVPEAQELTKQASFDQEFPADSADSALASYLTAHYQIKIASAEVDLSNYDTVLKVLKVNGLEKTASDLATVMVQRHRSGGMTKAASMFDTSDYRLSELQESLTGLSKDFVKAASLAQDLEQDGVILPAEYSVYAGNGILKVAEAVDALDARYARTGDSQYQYMSKIVSGLDPAQCEKGTRVKLASLIADLDTTHGLHQEGWDIYREAFDLTKSASDITVVELCGKQIPYSTIQKVGRATISAAIGEDVASEITGDALHDKQILETLPRDLQEVLCSLACNVG